MKSFNELRNIAIIAHVDHGKTTLTDSLLKQSGIFRDNQQVVERVMDSNALERERGITILAKCTAIIHESIKINIVDTPGHADFGGEVERVLSMVDGVLLLVDSSEGPMPQTKFVLGKALQQGLRPIVVINKVDRPDARIDEVVDEVFELFISLNASEEQLDFPILYASGRDGWASLSSQDRSGDLQPLFKVICEKVPAPKVLEEEQSFSMLVSILEYNSYLGRILIGKIYSGKATVNMPVKGLSIDGRVIEQAKLTKLFTFLGVDRVPETEVIAGDIVAIAGMTETSVADTVCDLQHTVPIKADPIDPPTLSIIVSVNDSPLSGTEGTKLTSRVIRERLIREASGNVSITVKETEAKDSFEVSGRGELQLGILIENMRREGFELSVSRPRVLFHQDPDTKETLEPIEEVIIDVDEEFSGTVIEKISLRKGELRDIYNTGQGKTRLNFLAPSRGLIGYHGEFLSDTRGTGVMNKIFHKYDAYKGPISGRFNGVLVSNDSGIAVAYALWKLEERGKLFINPGDKLYQGMIIGEHSKDNDLDVNPVREKQLTNFRTTSKDEAIRLTPPVNITLERAFSYVDDTELVEVTPKSIRLRKAILDPNQRKKSNKQ